MRPFHPPKKFFTLSIAIPTITIRAMTPTWTHPFANLRPANEATASAKSSRDAAIRTSPIKIRRPNATTFVVTPVDFADAGLC